MDALRTFPDLYSLRKYSILPEQTQRIIRALGDNLKNGIVDGDQIDSFRKELGHLPPNLAMQAISEIRYIGRLYGQQYTQACKLEVFFRLKKPVEMHAQAGWLLQYHGSGYSRENALTALKEPPQSAFEFMSIVYRMNDWVPEVRSAALVYAKKYLIATDPEIVAHCAFYLFQHIRFLSRWDDEAFKLAQEFLYQPTTTARLKDIFYNGTNGPVARVLREALKRPDLDTFLEKLATKAKLAAVRAMVIDALLNGRTQWSVGKKRQWINKPLGISRRIPDLKTRSLTVSANVQNLMEVASRDNSAKVRRIVASALIRSLNDTKPWHVEIVERLKNDRNPGVSSRIEFYLRKRGEAPS